MVEKREAYAPWSLTRKAGVQSATVNSDIEVPQFIQPTLSTGFVDENGDWKGQKSSDDQFLIDATHESVANGASVLSPQATPDYIDMIGFRHMMIAIKVTNGGNVALKLVMGPATNPFYNLRDVNANAVLKGFVDNRTETMGKLADDSAEVMTADVWNIFSVINYDYSGYTNLQWNITNNTGGETDITLAYLRLV